VEVIDYGIGIEPDKLPYIWNRFYQVKPNEREKCGMGVGLNIASEILKLHHAPFGAESTPNKGTCFWFMLEAYDEK
jgi:signal transduction histidine kinase